MAQAGTDEGLPDPEADQAAWDRLARRQKVERRARWHPGRGSRESLARDSVTPEPTPSGAPDAEVRVSGPPDPDLAALPDDRIYGDYSNREVASAMGHIVEGGIPVLLLVAPVWGLMLVLWLISGSLFSLVLLAAETAAYAAIAAFSLRQVRRRTPTSLRIDPDGFTARWAGRAAREQTVAFDRVRSADGRSWGWTLSKLPYARYFPPSILFSRLLPGAEVPSGSLPPQSGVVYLTDQNLVRIRAAWQRWDVVPASDDDAPLASRPSAAGTP